MNYIQIPGQPNVVLWQDETGNSGVINKDEPDWEVFQSWLDSGNQPESTEVIDTRPLETLRGEALSLINTTADAALLHITSRYPRTEIESWPEQCQEARAWLGNSSTPTSLLDAITGALNSAQKREFCEGVLSKATDYKGAVGTVIAWRRSCTLWVESQTERQQLMEFAPRFPEVPNAS